MCGSVNDGTKKPIGGVLTLRDKPSGLLRSCNKFLSFGIEIIVRFFFPQMFLPELDFGGPPLFFLASEAECAFVTRHLLEPV